MSYPFLAGGLIVLTVVLDVLILKTRVIYEKHTWIVFILFLIMTIIANGILVTLPIVTYTKSELIGVYLNNIPLEDFSYTIVISIIPLALYRYYENRT